MIAKPIAQTYGTLSALRAAAAATTSEELVAELSEIEGVGMIAEAIDRFVRDHVASASIGANTDANRTGRAIPCSLSQVAELWGVP